MCTRYFLAATGFESVDVFEFPEAFSPLALPSEDELEFSPPEEESFEESFEDESFEELSALAAVSRWRLRVP